MQSFDTEIAQGNLIQGWLVALPEDICSDKVHHLLVICTQQLMKINT